MIVIFGLFYSFSLISSPDYLNTRTPYARRNDRSTQHRFRRIFGLFYSFSLIDSPISRYTDPVQLNRTAQRYPYQIHSRGTYSVWLKDINQPGGEQLDTHGEPLLQTVAAVRHPTNTENIQTRNQTQNPT